MKTTRYILLTMALVFAVFMALFFMGLAFELFDLWFGSDPVRVTYLSIVGALFWPIQSGVLAMLSFLGAKDMEGIPPQAQEHFRLNRLGYLGWAGVFLIGLNIALLAVDEVTWGSAFANGFYELVAHRVYEGFLSAWLGALALYAHFRVSANKTLAAGAQKAP